MPRLNRAPVRASIRNRISPPPDPGGGVSLRRGIYRPRISNSLAGQRRDRALCWWLVRLFLHIFLAGMLAVCSPAWCACAIAQDVTESATESAGDGCGESCCPATDEHDDSQLPCRDKADCLCCDGAVSVPIATVKDIAGSSHAKSMDLALIPSCIAMIAPAAATVHVAPLVAGLSDAPPRPAESSSLLARRCLLLI